MIIVLIYVTVGGFIDHSISPTIVGPFSTDKEVTEWLDKVQPTLPDNHFVITSMDSPSSFEVNPV